MSDGFKALDFTKIVISKGGRSDLGTAEVGTTEIGSVEVSIKEIGMVEISKDEVGTAQVGMVEVGMVEVGSGEIGKDEVGFNINMLSPPLVPYLNSLFEYIKMFLVCHFFQSPLRIMKPHHGLLYFILRMRKASERRTIFGF